MEPAYTLPGKCGFCHRLDLPHFSANVFALSNSGFRNLLRGIHHHNPRVGDLTFTGYKVTEEWQKLEIAISLLSSMTIAVGSFFLFRLMLQDWWLAVAASSSVFAVIILAIQWMMRAAESI